MFTVTLLYICSVRATALLPLSASLTRLGVIFGDTSTVTLIVLRGPIPPQHHGQVVAHQQVFMATLFLLVSPGLLGP